MAPDNPNQPPTKGPKPLESQGAQKKFMKEDFEKLRVFWEENRGTVYPTDRETYDAFGVKYGYSWSQVKRAWKKISDKDEIEKAEKKEEKKRKRQQQSSSSSIDSSILRALSEEQVVEDEEEDLVDSLFRTTSSSSTPSSKTQQHHQQQQHDITTTTIKNNNNNFITDDFLAINHFESAQKHFFVLRYPSHLKYTYEGIRRNERELLINVQLTTRLDSTMLSTVLSDIEFDTGGTIKEKTTTAPTSQPIYTLSTIIPLDADILTATPFETDIDDDGKERLFIVVFDRHVETIKSAKPVAVYLKKRKSNVGTTADAVVSQSAADVDDDFE